MRDFERRGEGGDVFVLERKILSCPLLLSRFHCHLFLFSIYPVVWQADGSDYTVIINHGRKPWERRRDDKTGEGGKEGEIFKMLTGQHMCRSGPPVLISITLTAQTYIAPLGKVSAIWPLYQDMQFLSQRCEVFDQAWLDLIQRADVSHFKPDLERWTHSLQTTKCFLLLPSSHSPWQVLYVVLFNFVLQSGSDSSLVSCSVSPQSQCV